MDKWVSKKVPTENYKVDPFRLKGTYGITAKQFYILLEAQDGKCAICRMQFSRWGRNIPNIDHDHITGRVRGLLCRKCNTGLGFFKDNPDFLKMAAHYLR